MDNHKKQYLNLLFAVMLFITISSCKTQVTIAHGSSFGHCRGLCNKELIVAKQELTFTRWANGDQQDKITVTKTMQKDVYDQLIKNFDFKTFYTIDETIGCPDCADGGAEWVEVISGKKKKRVTFEYGHSPEKLKTTVEQLKRIQQSFEN